MSRLSQLRGTLQPIAASAATLAVALTALAAASDAPLLLLHQAGWRATVAAVGVDAALACIVALLGSPILAATIWALARVHRARSPYDWGWPFLVMVLGAGVALFLSDAFYRPHTAPYVIVALGFGAALAGMVTAVALAPPRVSNLVLLLGGGGALAVELVTPNALDRDLQDLLALLVAVAVVAALQPLYRRLARATLLGAGLAAALAATLLVLHQVDGWFPGWRALSWQHGHWEPRLSRTLRALIDFDNDGYSPMAWGGDCDDFDASRNPAAHDHDGIDANCNGTVKPLHASDGERGLWPPGGDPDAPPGSVDLVVLITIDCLRYDALLTEVMPRLEQLAHSGIALERLYTAGTDTIKALPLALRGRDGAPPIAERLRRHGIATTALFATHNPRLEPAVLPGFEVALVPTEQELRWEARELTDRALAALPAGRGLMWLHYYDAHLPYPRGPARLPAPPGRPAEMARYLTALQSIDEQIGRLQDELVRSGRWARTLFIVTSDHGEAFGEHGVPYHGLGAWEAVAHVPGVVAGGLVKPLRSQALTSHRDLPATVLGAFGLVAGEPAVEEFGRSWLRLRQSAALHQFAVVRSASGPGGSRPMAALVEARFKLIVTFENDLVQLYDLQQDPDEKRDLRVPLAGDAARLQKQLALYRDIDDYP